MACTHHGLRGKKNGSGGEEGNNTGNRHKSINDYDKDNDINATTAICSTKNSTPPAPPPVYGGLLSGSDKQHVSAPLVRSFAAVSISESVNRLRRNGNPCGRAEAGGCRAVTFATWRRKRFVGPRLGRRCCCASGKCDPLRTNRSHSYGLAQR